MSCSSAASRAVVSPTSLRETPRLQATDDAPRRLDTHVRRQEDVFDVFEQGIVDRCLRADDLRDASGDCAASLPQRVAESPNQAAPGWLFSCRVLSEKSDQWLDNLGAGRLRNWISAVRLTRRIRPRSIANIGMLPRSVDADIPLADGSQDVR